MTRKEEIEEIRSRVIRKRMKLGYTTHNDISNDVYVDNVNSKIAEESYVNDILNGENLHLTPNWYD